MTAGELRLHLRYSGWASQKILEAAVTLEEDPLSRELGVSHHSVLETLSHIYFADAAWFSRVADPGMNFRPDKVSMEQLCTKWKEIQNRWERWADSLADDELTRIVAYKSWKGDPCETPLWQIVLHVVNHATLHRGQVVSMLRQLGVPPPPTDLIFYYRSLPSER
jgi:uncharacterized damage-inducible protein DinB